MQANRYDRAAEAPIMNTYVPINFGELYRIGQAQRQAVEQAANEFTNTVSKFGEFQSPSAVDTQRYYENSLGKIKDLIDEAATNPDAMKDANFRARLNSRVANLDYATLSNLRQSREGMLARQKANQELMMKGMYNPLWHDVDFTNYSTVDSGIFNDVAPLAYKSEVDLVRPYVDNLKASFMGVKDGWIHQGVSTDRTDYEIQRNLSSIQNTPEYQKHLEVLQRQGLSRQNAEEQLNRTLITAGREFAYDQAQRDPWWIESAKIQARAAAAAKNNPNNLLNLTEQVHMDSRRRIYENFTDMTPEEMNAVTRHGINVLSKDRRDAVLKQLDPSVMQDKLRNSFESVYSHTRSRNAAIDYVINAFSSPLDPDTAIDIYGKYGTTGKKDSNGNYIGKKSSDFILQDELAFSMLGDVNQLGTQTARNAIFTDMWNNGEFNNFIISPETKQVTDGGQTYQTKYAFIPLNQFNKDKFFTSSGKDDDENARSLYDAVKEAGLEVVTLNNSDTSGSVVVRLDNRDNIDSKSITTKNDTEYVMVPVATVIPSSGQAAVAADIQFQNSRKVGTDVNVMQNIRSESMRFPYSNIDDDNE